MTPASTVWFDHCVVAIDDLARGVSAFETLTGVCPVAGGAHPSLGTENALVSLGNREYLEILAPRPGGVLHPMVCDIGSSRTLTPFLWALATDDLNRLRRRLSGAGFVIDEPMAGARLTDAGDTLHWSMCLMAPGSPANSPFFIEWAPETRHPSAGAPTGCARRAFTVASDGQVELQRLLDTVGYDSTVGAPPSDLALTLETPHGRVAIP